MDRSQKVGLGGKSPLPDLAIGSYEAACVTGTHFTRPAKLAKAGALVYRPLESGWGIEGANEFFLYSLRDCNENFADYVEAIETGSLPGRRRGEDCLARREPMLKRLREVEQILYDDAIGTAEAASILGLHITMVNRMIREGKLLARKAFNDRHGDGKGSVYIVSRRACEENRKTYSALEAAGKKTGSARAPRGQSPKVHRKAPATKKKKMA
jgi:hypothetical protein